MSLDTNFNKSPYFDDFDEDKRYHRILFKPAVALQARELNQMQSILQNQVERFGNNILVDGTIIEGGNFVEETDIKYVKLLDVAKNSLGNEVATDVNQYVNLKAIGQINGLEAMIIATDFGLETQSPNLSTLYVKYTKYAVAGGANITAFIPGETIQLLTQNQYGDYVNPFHTVTVATGIVDPAPVGNSYGVRCGEGILYQKGNFIRFQDGLTIISKYDNMPHNVVVGFITDEAIVNYNADSSLLDNASGFNNENAPGADRLKLTSKLVSREIGSINPDESFFAIQEYQEGRVVRRKLLTQYNTIQKEMEKRTSEESGNYVVNRFGISVQDDVSNNEILNIVVDPGLAYVEGKRVELINSIKIPLPDANTSANVIGQDVTTNYGSFVEVENLKGLFDYANLESISLYRSGDTSNAIGTALVRSVTKQSNGTSRIYLTNIKMSNDTYSFANTFSVKSTSNGTANVIQSSGKTVLKDSSFDTLIYNTGKDFIRSIDTLNSSFIYRNVRTISYNSNTVVLTTTTPDIFPYTPNSSLNSDEIRDFIFTAGGTSGPISAGEELVINSATVDSTGEQVTLNLAKTPAGTTNGYVYYNARKRQIAKSEKSLDTVYVKIDPNSHPNSVNGPYSLGLPDVYDIVGVWKDTTWNAVENLASTNAVNGNISSYFILNENQKNGFYDLSEIRKKKTGGYIASDKIIVKARVFRRTGGVNNFFTYDSYPVDDVTIPLPDNKIRTEMVPYYNDIALRDAIDLRPYAQAVATYATTPTTATTNPAPVVSFASGVLTPAPNRNIVLNYTYYLPRRDVLVIRDDDFELIQGIPSDTPAYPPLPSRSMELARFDVAPFPTLSPSEAYKLDKPEYGVGFQSNQTKRYTMKDIASIDKRIDNLEYYTSLSLLESSARDMNITDSAGLTRFKNGIFIDNFRDLFSANVRDGDFAAAMDPEYGNVGPKIKQYFLDVALTGSSGVDINAGKFATLKYNSYPIPSVSQEYATDVKNCTTGFYSYKGTVFLEPPYDSGPDTVKAPDLNFELDMTQAFMDYTDALNEIIPLNKTSVNVQSTTTKKSSFFGIIKKYTTTTTTTTTNTSFDVVEGSVDTVDVGDYVRDVNFSPFMRANLIQIKVYGLRPNTKHYFFFDERDINGIDNPNGAVLPGVETDGAIILDGELGDDIITDDNGELTALIAIPGETYYVGDREIVILDVDKLANIDAATSSASRMFSAYNFSSTQSNLTITTRIPEFVASSSSTTRVTTHKTTRLFGIKIDPISQTFILDREISNDSDIFLTGVDLFFARKGKTNGVTVEIREVENGYPAGTIVPFSKVHLSNAEINAPSNAIATSAKAVTHVDFEGPLALKTDTEYAICITPDGNDPDFLVWISKTGNIDVDLNIPITQDTNAGTLFTSTNNKAWTAYQDENMKFTLYGANFSTASGYVDLGLNSPEFLQITNETGTFAANERVFPVLSTYATGTVSVTNKSNIVTGSGTNFTSTYQIGRHIIVKQGASYYARKVINITNNTSLIVDEPFWISGSGLNHYAAAVAKVSVFDATDTLPLLIAIESDATSSAKFNIGNTVYGETSQATGEINTVMDFPVSYIQPAVYRSNFGQTRTSLTVNNMWNGQGYISRQFNFGETNYLDFDRVFIRSKSLDPTTQPFVLRINLESLSNTPYTSPVVDFDISGLMFTRYIIGNALDDSQNDTLDISERHALGYAKARFISKDIQLSSELAAEDLKLYLTAYKPSGTDLRVYAKFKSDSDNRAMRDVEWTRLNLVQDSESFSSKTNRYDYREYRYELPTTSKAANEGVWINNDTIQYIVNAGDGDVLYQDFSMFTLKIVMLSNTHNLVPRLKDIRAIAVT